MNYNKMEPTDEEMIRFLNLLKANNTEAQAANVEYTTTQNKEKFYAQIISICRAPPATAANAPLSESQSAPRAKKPSKHCFNFRQGKCNRGSNCKFVHTLEQSEASISPVAPAAPPKAVPIPAAPSSIIDMSPTAKPQSISTSSPEGNKDCGSTTNGGSKSACQFYMTNGCCRKGDKCKYAHPNSERQGQTWMDPGRSALRGIVSLGAQSSTSSKLLASKIGIRLSSDDTAADTTMKDTADDLNSPAFISTNSTMAAPAVGVGSGTSALSSPIRVATSIEDPLAPLNGVRTVDTDGAPPYGGILEFLESRSSGSGATVGSTGHPTSSALSTTHDENMEESAAWMSLNLANIKTPPPLLAGSAGGHAASPGDGTVVRGERIMVDRGIMAGGFMDDGRDVVHVMPRTPGAAVHVAGMSPSTHGGLSRDVNEDLHIARDDRKCDIRPLDIPAESGHFPNSEFIPLPLGGHPGCGNHPGMPPFMPPQYSYPSSGPVGTYGPPGMMGGTPPPYHPPYPPPTLATMYPPHGSHGTNAGAAYGSMHPPPTGDNALVGSPRRAAGSSSDISTGGRDHVAVDTHAPHQSPQYPGHPGPPNFPVHHALPMNPYGYGPMPMPPPPFGYGYGPPPPFPHHPVGGDPFLGQVPGPPRPPTSPRNGHCTVGGSLPMPPEMHHQSHNNPQQVGQEQLQYPLQRRGDVSPVERQRQAFEAPLSPARHQATANVGPAGHLFHSPPPSPGASAPASAVGPSDRQLSLLDERNDLLQRLAGATFGDHNIGMPMPPSFSVPSTTPPPGMRGGSSGASASATSSRTSNGVIGKPAHVQTQHWEEQEAASPTPTRLTSPSAQLDGGRTQVLLSYLRSRGISPSMSQGSIDEKAAVLDESTASHLKTEGREETSIASAGSTDLSSTHTPSDEQHESSDSAVHTTAAAAPPKVPYRVTLGQRGRLHVSITTTPDRNQAASGGGGDTGSDHVAKACAPGGNINIEWELPTEIWQRQSADLVLSLCRYGTHLNTTNIIAKALTSSKQVACRVVKKSADSPDVNGEVTTGLIKFHAPRAAGHYVFRVYDKRNDDTASLTLAASTPFCVELRGRDVTSNLNFALEALAKTKVDSGSVNSLKNTFELMRSTGVPLQGKHPADMIQQCVHVVLDAVQKQMVHLTARDEALNLQSAAEKQGESAPVIEESVWTKAKGALRIHSAVFNCLCELRANQFPWSMLSPSQKDTVISVMSLYCPVLKRFFDNSVAINTARVTELGFLPAPPTHAAVASSIFPQLNASICNTLGSLMPSRDFYPKREEVRARLQRLICSCDAVPPSTELVVFGSSRNNFGNDTADLDMCLHYGPEEVVPTGDDRGALMEKLGEILTSGGMENVQVRSSARIPIVLFTDPTSGLDCDISFNNPLAIRNTLLLASYSVIDPRVRELAYIIKFWAKRRHANSPQEGTLSSYGYLLCLVYFLQTRTPPVVPILQKLVPDWDPSMPPCAASCQLPKRWERHPVEECYCNTYFYEASFQQSMYTASTQAKLHAFSSRNTQSTAELLTEFFRFFAYEFDYHTRVVSIRQPEGDLTAKLNKMEYDCWGSHDRLSIEDPFETWYDVAHVIKAPQMAHMRKEFLRAYTLILRAGTADRMQGRSPPVDAIPTVRDPHSLFDIICEEGDLPKFVVQALEKHHK